MVIMDSLHSYSLRHQSVLVFIRIYKDKTNPKGVAIRVSVLYGASDKNVRFFEIKLLET
jgi:hypothetical protein